MREKEPWAGFDPATSTLPRIRNDSADSVANHGRGSESRPAAFWTEFSDYLQKQNGSRQYNKTTLAKAREYCTVISTGDARPLLSLTFDKRVQAMKSLSVLSKYAGCYGRWKEIMQAHALKWSESSDGGVSLFMEIANGKENLSAMIEWLKSAVNKLPTKYGQVLVYDCLTGLRASEACMSLQLLNSGAENYRNDEQGTLEHYRFADKFIRRTKRVYVSITNDEILSIAGKADTTGYNGLRLAVRRRDLTMNAGYGRKVFGTWLKSKGIQTESVDLLQGRISKSVFVRHYWRPDFEQERQKIRGLLGGLLNELS